MTTFRKFVGSFKQVWDQLDAPKTFYMQQPSLEAYENQVEKDLARMSFLSYDHSVDEIKSRLKATDHLTTPEQRCYSQGTFEGTAFKFAAMSTSPGYHIFMTAAKKLDKDYDRSFGAAYIDDDGTPCAFGIYFMKDYSQPFDNERQKGIYSITLIRKTNAPPDEREVIHFSDPGLLRKNVIQQGKEVDSYELFDEIKRQTHSQKLNQLLAPLFQNDTVSYPYFNELIDRIRPNRNVDNRDVRKVQLAEYINFARDIKDAKVQDAISTIVSSEENIHFYSVPIFQRNLELLHTIIKEALRSASGEETDNRHVVNKLLFLAIRLELEADLIDANESEREKLSHLYIQYTKDAKFLRELINDPTTEKAQRYAALNWDDLHETEKVKAKKIQELQTIIKNYEQQKVSNQALSNLLKKLMDRHKDSDFYDLENNLVELEEEIKKLLEVQKKAKGEFSEALEIKLAELKVFIKDFKANYSLPEYLDKLIQQKIHTLEQIQKNPSANEVEQYASLASDELIDLDQLFNEELDKFRNINDYVCLRITSSSEINSSEKSEQYREKLLNKIDGFKEQKKEKDEERKSAFYERLERLIQILNKLPSNQFTRGVKEEIHKLRDQPLNAKVLSEYATTDFIGLTHKLCVEAAKRQKRSIQRERINLLPEPELPEKPEEPEKPRERQAPENTGIYSRNQTSTLTALISFIAFLLSVGLIASGILLPLGVAGAIITFAIIVGAGADIITTEQEFSTVIEDYQQEQEKYLQQSEAYQQTLKNYQQRIKAFPGKFENYLDSVQKMLDGGVKGNNQGLEIENRFQQLEELIRITAQEEEFLQTDVDKQLAKLDDSLSEGEEEIIKSAGIQIQPPSSTSTKPVENKEESDTEKKTSQYST